MRRRLPPLKQLLAFEAVARHESFSLAADELCLTNGAVSRQVKTLEEKLGVALFSRLKHGIELTTAGQCLLPAVHAAFDGLEVTTGDLLAERRPGSLLVGCPPSLAVRFLIPQLPLFRALCPNIEVHLKTLFHSNDLRSEKVDVAVVLGGLVGTEGLFCEKILEEFHGPVCHPRLLEGRRRESGDWLPASTLLHSETRLESWADWNRTLGISGLDISSGLRFTHTFLMLEAAAMGLGVGVGSQCLVANDLASGRLTAPFGFIASGRVYYVCCRKDWLRRAKVRSFCDWLLSLGENYMNHTENHDEAAFLYPSQQTGPDSCHVDSH